MADHRINQEFHRDINISNSNNVQVGISTDTGSALKEWMHQLAGSPVDTEELEKHVKIENLRKRLFSNQDFRECLSSMKKTVVLEGAPGVGKTTAILAVVDELKDSKRLYGLDRQNYRAPDTLQVKQGPVQMLVGYVKRVSYDLYPTGARLVAKYSLIRRLIALFTKTASPPAPTQENVPEIQSSSTFSVVVAAVFFSALQRNKQTTTKTLGFLLYQIVRQIPETTSHVHELHRKFNNTDTHPSATELEETIIAVVTGQRTCLFLDALDECSIDVLADLLPCIMRIQDQTNAGIVFTDRIEQRQHIWKRYFPSAARVPVWAEKNDINDYVKMRLNKEADQTERQDHWIHEKACHKDVESAVAEASGRIFLLVRLNVNYVLGSHSKVALEKDLNVVRSMGCEPQSSDNQYHQEVLTVAYTRNVDRVLNQELPWRQREYPRLILGYMRDAYRPITMPELRYSLCTNVDVPVPLIDGIPTTKEIKNVCQGLVDSDQGDSVHFLHTTFKEYLASQEGIDKIPYQNERLAASCVTYLCKTEDFSGVCTSEKDLETRLRERPFLGYCARYWDKHLARVQTSMSATRDRLLPSPTKRLLSIALEFLRCAPRVEAAYQIAMLQDPILQKTLLGFLTSSSSFSIAAITFVLEPQRRLNPYQSNGKTGLHLVCAHGLHMLFDDLALKVAPNILDAKDHRGRTPLYCAAESGHLDLVQHLDRLGASRIECDDLGQNPLQLAITEKQIPVASWFLDQKGSNDVYNQTRYDHSTAAVKVSIIRTDKPSMMWTTGEQYMVSGRSVLHDAVKAESLELVQRILAIPKLDIDSMDSQGMTPLHKSSKSGNIPILEELVLARASICQRIGVSQNGQPYSDSARKHHHYQGTALHLACKYGHTEMAERILQTCPELLQAENAVGQVPLHHAAMAPNAKAAQFLLKHQLDLNVKDASGQTPLHLAASLGSFETVKFFTECDGIDLNVRNDMLRTPLFLSVESVNPENFDVLWASSDAHRDGRDVAGMSLYEYALRSGSHARVKDILSWTQLATGTYWEQMCET